MHPRDPEGMLFCPICNLKIPTDYRMGGHLAREHYYEDDELRYWGYDADLIKRQFPLTKRTTNVKK